MVFSSLIFIFIFFPLMLLFYFLFKGHARNIVLLIFSLVFYAWGEPIYIILMLFSSVVDYTNGRMIEKFETRQGLQKVLLVLSICVNLMLLGYFKYSGFFIESVNHILSTHFSVKALRLPIGISFYTFQTMSYSIDVYRKKVKVEHNFINFMVYVSMFPQLIAGPIVRYSTIQEELQSRTITKQNVYNGILRITQGLAKKVLLANSIGLLATTVINADATHISALTAWLGVIAFAFQIYFDFSGYSDMAIGMGKLLGFSYPENFNHPYMCNSITNFWQRWHISLSSWFKDYVYIPLGGNRNGNLRTIVNLLIVWGLTGMWHGAAWNFIYWGVYFGVILVLEKFVFAAILNKTPKLLRRFYALFAVLIGWVIFMLETPAQIGGYISTMFSFSRIADDQFLFLLSNYATILVLCTVFSLPLKHLLANHVQKWRSKPIFETGYVALYVFAFMLSVIYIVDNTFNPFLYFRF